MGDVFAIIAVTVLGLATIVLTAGLVFHDIAVTTLLTERRAGAAALPQPPPAKSPQQGPPFAASPPGRRPPGLTEMVREGPGPSAHRQSGRSVGHAQTDFSPSLVAGGEFLRRLLRHRHGIGTEQQTHGCIVLAGEVMQYLRDPTRVRPLMTGGAA